MVMSQTPPTGYAGAPGRPGPPLRPASPGPYPPPPPQRRVGLIVGLVIAALIVVCGGLTGLAALFTPPGGEDGPTAPPDPSTPVAQAPVAPVPSASPRAATNTIGDGTWTAGTDFPVGRYETTSDNKLCGWQVYTGQEPDVTYVDPGHIGPGHYVFTFKAGQHLMTSGCGTWKKAG